MLIKTLIDNCFICNHKTTYWEGYVDQKEYVVFRECSSSDCYFTVKEHYLHTSELDVIKIYFYNVLEDSLCCLSIINDIKIIFPHTTKLVSSAKEAIPIIRNYYDNLLLL